MISKTRDGSSIIGKKNIYFCSHPEDREYYLKEITEDIFYVTNCAVWHDDGTEISESNRLFFCENMDLVVIPVTDKFLYDNNYAKDTEVEIFKKARIPILPIITDESQFTAANALFGNRQVLEHTVTDKTKLGYYNKLERFLRGFLMGETLFKEYSKVFTDTLFISYRKKDRSIILDLLAKIHSNPNLRTVGVWYDEFLTPTEVFTKEIENSIVGSSYVVMLITPNTLERGNYIITDEYPYASENKKKIIGVLSGVSREQATQMFPKIKEFVDIEDENLPVKIESYFQLKPVDIDDLHKLYWLGLCYMSGINVERNSEYAIEYLTKSSDKGNMDAAAILSSIYADGIGVEQDPEKEIMWAQKYVQNAKQSGNIKKITESMLILSDSYDRHDLIEESNRTHTELMDYLTRQNDAKEVLSDVAQAVLYFGNNLLRRGLYQQATDAFVNVKNMYSQLAVDNTQEYGEDSYLLTQLKYNLGTSLFKTGNYMEAKKYFEDVVHDLGQYTRLDPEGYNDIYIKALDNLALVYRNIGYMNHDNQKLYEAEQLMRRSVEIADDMLLTRRRIYEPLLASSCQILATFYMSVSMYDESSVYFAKAIDSYNNILKFKDSDCSIELAQTCNNYAVLLRQLGENDKALQYAVHGAKEIKDHWLKAPTVYNLMYAKALTSVAIIFTAMDDYENAAKHFMSAIDLYKVSQRKSIEAYEGTAECYMEFGVMFMKDGQQENAVKCLDYAKKYYQILAKNGYNDYSLQLNYIEEWRSKIQ